MPVISCGSGVQSKDQPSGGRDTKILDWILKLGVKLFHLHSIGIPLSLSGKQSYKKNFKFH